MQTPGASGVSENLNLAETGRELGAPLSAIELVAALETAARHAQEAKDRGYGVTLALVADPFGVRITVRKRHNGHLTQALKIVGASPLLERRGKSMLFAIEQCITEIESFLFGQDYLPALQAKHEHNVNNACKFFYDELDVILNGREKCADWTEFTESHPEQAAALRRAIQAAMRGGR